MTEWKTKPCEACGADMIWASTERGRKIPLDAKPETRFVIYRLPDGAPQAVATKTYISHFATCPEADRFRKERGSKGRTEG